VGFENLILSLWMTSESRTWGHEAKQRPRRDDARSGGIVIITDPTQTALGDAVVRGWQTYVNIVSVQHGVYLQVLTSTCITFISCRQKRCGNNKI